MDREILRDSNAQDYEVVGALIRLSAIRDPNIRKEVNDRIKSKSSIIRSGVADALGYYEDKESLSALKELLNELLDENRHALTCNPSNIS